MNATIILKDEVNCSIDGLTMATRKELQKQFSYILPHARHTPSFKMGRWDGKVSFFSAAGKTYIKLLDEILEYLISKGYTIELDDRRDSFKASFQPITADMFSEYCWPEGHKLANQPIVAEPHQVKACNNFLLDENHHAIQEASTGAGKTLITAMISKRAEEVGKTIIIVPNKDLIKQTRKMFELVGMDVGVYYGDEKDITHIHTICTWQSLNQIDKEFKSGGNYSLRDFSEGVNTVIVDECFAGDTLITTPNGKVPIKDLKVGDTVVNFCEQTKTYKEDTVVKVHRNLMKSESEKMLELSFDNGVKIEVTANHKFLTNVGWVRADNLTEDMEIIDINTYEPTKKSMELVSSKEIEKPEATYNLHIENDHNYIANDAVVSNCHGVTGNALKNILTTSFSHIPIRWGFTGTVPKDIEQFSSLLVSIGKVVGKITARELQDTGFLAECHIDVVQFSDNRVFSAFEDERAWLASYKPRIKKCVEMANALEGNTLLLVNNIDTGNIMVEELAAMGVDAKFIHGNTKNRSVLYDEINRSERSITVATFGVAAVGIDIARLNNLVLYEVGKSFIRVIQSVGRVLRTSYDKSTAYIIDCTSDCKFSKRHLTKRKAFYKEASYPFKIHKVTY